MLARLLAAAASAALAATPCLAADLGPVGDSGERRSSAAAGVYFAVPFGGARSGRPQSGLRLQMRHDFRDASAPTTRAVTRDTLELRLIGEERPTLFVAEQAVTGREARQNLFAGGIMNLVVIGLAVVGAVVIYNELDDDEDAAPDGEDEVKCQAIGIC